MLLLLLDVLLVVFVAVSLGGSIDAGGCGAASVGEPIEGSAGVGGCSCASFRDSIVVMGCGASTTGVVCDSMFVICSSGLFCSSTIGAALGSLHTDVSLVCVSSLGVGGVNG